MELRRIVAKDARSAHERAIALYGRDAVIVATTQIDGQTELVVAIEPAAPPGPSGAPAPAGAPPPAGARDGAPFRAAVEAVMHLRQAEAAQPSAIRHPAMRPESPHGQGSELVELVRREIGQLRAELIAGQRNGHALGRVLAPGVGAIAQTLLDDGVPGPLRKRLTAAMAECRDAAGAIDAMRRSLLEAMPAPLVPNWRGVHALYGPSGAGKTLMSARLAFEQAREHGADAVAWISYGETHAAAWSEVQVLAAQAGVEAFRARDATTLALLLEEFAGRSTVLVDTPGNDFVRLAATMAAEFPQIARHAVIDADASAGSLRRLAGAPGAKWRSVLLTKTDEAVQPWPLLRCLFERPDWQVSATGSGDRVVGTLHAFSPDEIVALVLTPIAEAARADGAATAPPPPPTNPAWTPYRALHA